MESLTRSEQERAVELHRTGHAPGEIATEISRGVQSVRYFLIIAGEIVVPRPRGMDDAALAAIATDYRKPMSIRACSKKHHRTYATTRRALLHLKIPLHPIGKHTTPKAACA